MGKRTYNYQSAADELSAIAAYWLNTVENWEPLIESAITLDVDLCFESVHSVSVEYSVSVQKGRGATNCSGEVGAKAIAAIFADRYLHDPGREELDRIYSAIDGSLTSLNGPSKKLLDSTSGVWSEECQPCSGRGEKDCDSCGARGKVQCRSCYGNGTLTCHGCSGQGQTREYVASRDGHYEWRICTTCFGRRETACHGCSGSRVESCSACGGQGALGCGTCGQTGALTKSYNAEISISKSLKAKWDADGKARKAMPKDWGGVGFKQVVHSLFDGGLFLKPQVEESLEWHKGSEVQRIARNEFSVIKQAIIPVHFITAKPDPRFGDSEPFYPVFFGESFHCISPAKFLESTAYSLIEPTMICIAMEKKPGDLFKDTASLRQWTSTRLGHFYAESEDGEGPLNGNLITSHTASLYKDALSSVKNALQSKADSISAKDWLLKGSKYTIIFYFVLVTLGLLIALHAYNKHDFTAMVKWEALGLGGNLRTAVALFNPSRAEIGEYAGELWIWSFVSTCASLILYRRIWLSAKDWSGGKHVGVFALLYLTVGLFWTSIALGYVGSLGSIDVMHEGYWPGIFSILLSGCGGLLHLLPELLILGLTLSYVKIRQGGDYDALEILDELSNPPLKNSMGFNG